MKIEVVSPHIGIVLGAVLSVDFDAAPVLQHIRRTAPNNAEHTAAEGPPAEGLTTGAAFVDVEALYIVKRYAIGFNADVHALILSYRDELSIQTHRSPIYITNNLKKRLTEWPCDDNIGR